jgi:hypothetical protein
MYIFIYYSFCCFWFYLKNSMIGTVIVN